MTAFRRRLPEAIARIAVSEIGRSRFPVTTRLRGRRLGDVDPVLHWTRKSVAEAGSTATLRKLSLAEQVPFLTDASRLGRLLAAVAEELWDEAAGALEQLDDRLALTSLPIETIRTAAVRQPERVVHLVGLLLDAPWAPSLPVSAWDALAPALAVSGASASYERVVGVLAESGEIDEGRLEWLGQWHRDSIARRESFQWPSDETTPALAILDYRHPDEIFASTNIGDHVQTLALVSHLLRQRALELDIADPALAGQLEHLRGGMRESTRAERVAGRLRVGVVNRDFSSADRPRAGSFAFVFGWYMWPLAGDRFDFPMNTALEKVFVSFHINERGLLTDEAVAGLRASGPVGCRDWTTVGLLRSRGVDAFFSGCLTTTLFQYFEAPSTGERREGPIGFIDSLPNADEAARLADDIELVEQSTPDILRRSFVENLVAAEAFLTDIRSRFRSVVTSRLHTYLPARALGTPVDFRPADIHDVRFEGLVGIDDAAFAAVQQRLLDRLEAALGAIVEGRTGDEVRALWADLWADERAAAASRFDTARQPAS